MTMAARGGIATRGEALAALAWFVLRLPSAVWSVLTSRLSVVVCASTTEERDIEDDVDEISTSEEDADEEDVGGMEEEEEEEAKMLRGRPGLDGTVVPRGGDPVSLTGLANPSPLLDVKGIRLGPSRVSLNWRRNSKSHVLIVSSDGEGGVLAGDSGLNEGDCGLNGGDCGDPGSSPRSGGPLNGDRGGELKIASFCSAISRRRAYPRGTRRCSSNRFVRYSLHTAVLCAPRHHQQTPSVSCGCIPSERPDSRRERFQLSQR